jgi:hypothetical protein
MRFYREKEKPQQQKMGRNKQNCKKIQIGNFLSRKMSLRKLPVSTFTSFRTQ